MIRYSCPKCGVNLKSADDKAGARTACPRCGELVTVPGPAEEKAASEPAAKGKAPATGKKPVAIYAGIGVAVLAVVGVGVGMMTMSSGSKTPGSMSQAQFSDNVPKPRRTQAPPKPPPPKEAPKAAPKSEDEQLAEASKPKPSQDSEMQVRRKGKSKPADEAASKPVTPKPAETPAEQAPPVRSEVPEREPFRGDELYKQMLKSTVLVGVITPNELGWGTGSVIDLKNKLVLTNEHVVQGASNGMVFVLFPLWQKGQLVVERDQYAKLLRAREDVVPAYVEHQDPRRDLALLRVAALPDHVKPIHLSHESLVPGQTVTSLGNPGASSSFWVMTTGSARSYPHHQKWPTMIDKNTKVEREATIVETQSPVNHGDSGGPVVNDRGELVAVTEGGAGGEDVALLNYFIDISDVRKFLQEYYKKKNLPAPAESVPAAEVARDLDSLKRALHEHNASRRAWASDQLASLGPEAKNAVPDLMELLQQEKDDNVRVKATKALGEIGNLSPKDLETIIALMKDPKLQDLRLQAILVVRHMGEEAVDAVPALIERLKDESSDIRQEAAKTLGNLGPLAKSAVPALAELLQRRDKKHEVRQEAALAIGNIHSDDPAGAALGVSALEAGLRDPIRDVRLSSLQGLEKVGSDGKTAIPQILKSLKERDREMRAQAVVTLGAIGPDAKEAVGPLATMVVDDKELRATAGQSLAKIKKPAVNALIKLLTVPNPAVRRVAIEALGEIGPDAGPLAARALAVLNQREGDKQNRELIAEAVKKILEK